MGLHNTHFTRQAEICLYLPEILSLLNAGALYFSKRFFYQLALLMDVLLTIHSHNRNLFLLLALVAIVKLAWNIIQKSEFGSKDMIILRIFSALMTVQFFIGLILLYHVGSTANWDMSALRHQFEHAFTMILALGLSHMAPMARKAEASARNTRALLYVTATLVLIIVGVAQLRGMSFWMGGA